MNITLEQAAQLDMNNTRARHKNKLINKGENSLYFELKMAYPDGMAFGLMKAKDYVEMLKAEIAEENQQ